MKWVEVLSKDQLPEGERRVVEVGGREILLVHHGGETYAVDNTCPHMGAALEGGEVTGDGLIVCPRHHSVFDLRTGDVKDWAPWPPGVGRVLGAISRERPLSVFPTRVEKGSVWVGLEEPQPDAASQLDITVYGADWCGDVRRAKKFLDEQQLQYKWVDTDGDPEARAYVEKVNDGKRTIPTIVFGDGSILVEPTNAELAAKLGVQY